MTSQGQPIVLLEDNDDDAKAINDTHGSCQKRSLGFTSEPKKKCRSLVGENEMERLILMAEYEVNQDPYRGMGLLSTKAEFGKEKEERFPTHLDFDHSLLLPL